MAEFHSSIDYLIVHAKSRKELKELELLFLSKSIPFSIQNNYGEKSFFIPLHYETFAKNEIRQYQKENRNWPPIVINKDNLFFRFSYLHFLVVLCLAYFHFKTTHLTPPSFWRGIGRFSADLVLNGEWWRTITSLTLHLDDAHLLSNFFGLLIFIGGVNQFVGSGFSWLLVLFSGALGNYLNALLYQTAHNSIGASTAVFGAVGIIGAFGIKRYYQHRQLKTRYFVPLLAALGIFAMLGTSPQTDVTAHLFGFLSGVGIGLLFIPLTGSQLLDNKIIQFLAFSVFCVIIYTAWNVDIIYNWFS